MQLSRIQSKLLPEQVDNSFSGPKLSAIVFALIVLASLVRSLIHMFAPDGGAGSIAGLDLSGGGAQGVIFAFGLWGSSQLLMSLFQLLVVIRYRSLIPLMYLFIILETLLRMIIGWVKPVDFQRTPPGAVGNWVILPLVVVMFGLCFLKREDLSF